MSAPALAADSVRVGLARTQPSYAGLEAPWSPTAAYPEFARWGAAWAGGSGAQPAESRTENHVYAAVRAALASLGLDADRYGSGAWNPLGELVDPGARVVLKPNFIRHWNPCEDGTVESVITHGSVLRVLIDYAFLAVGAEGSVVIAEAAQHDCDFAQIRALAGLDAMVALYRTALDRDLEVIDLRRESVIYRDGVIVERTTLPGDPAGYRLIDLGARSAFADSGLDPHRFRGADYDIGPTTQHHLGGRHEYLLSETVLAADLVVNLPKLKTHKKTGVTLALKNLVGINGDKNLLPHHCVGSEADGGDEFPGQSVIDRTRSRATEVARRLLMRGIGKGLVRVVRRVENAARGEDFIRSGNWYRNRTTWRMVLDLNRLLYYCDARGDHLDADAPVRKVLTVIDGIVAGEGEGPLAPLDRPLGVVLASLDPLALDCAAIRLMGFDEGNIPKVREAMRDDVMRLSRVRSAADVVVCEGAGSSASLLSLDALDADEPFTPHSGWLGHVEKRPCAA